MKKLASKRGFTLTEMLIAVLLLGFVSIMAAVMTSAVLNNTVIVKEVAQAEILGSEALDNIQAELRFALDVKVPKVESPNEAATEITFSHDDANPGCVLKLKDGKIILKIKQADGTVSEDELFVGVSYGNLKISELTFAEGEGAAAGSVIVTVYISYGDNVLWHGSVSVRPINGMGTEG